MKIFSATYGDYIKFDAKPNEDAFFVSRPKRGKPLIVAVADGVTQSHYPNNRYALPYGAKEAAKIFCHSTVKHLEKNLYSTFRTFEKLSIDFKNAFDFANQKIRELNYKHGINEKTMDYTTHDWFDTVGVAAVLVKNNLYYGFVGDCGLAIFDKNNKKKFQTKDMVEPVEKKFERLYPNLVRTDFMKTPGARAYGTKDFKEKMKRTIIMHRYFRNNPNKKGYGSFTGELSVKNYYTLGTKKLNKEDMAVLYSDGLVELLRQPEFLKILREQNKLRLRKFVMQKAKENPAKYGHDRTFVSVIM